MSRFYHVQQQNWQRWPKVLVMECRDYRDDRSIDMETRRYLPDRETCRAEETETYTAEVHGMECTGCGGTYEHVNGGYEYCPRCGARIEEGK